MLIAAVHKKWCVETGSLFFLNKLYMGAYVVEGKTQVKATKSMLVSQLAYSNRHAR